MAKSVFGARFPSDETLAALKERLLAAGFAEAAVGERLGAPHPAVLSLDRYPVYATALAARSPLDVAIDLFLLQGEVARDEAEALLGADVVDHLLAARLLEPAGRARRGPRARVAAAVSVYPCDGCFFATDHRWRPTALLRRGAPREPVMYLGGDSYALAYLAPRRPVEAALDLCTGSGVQAILAARHAGRVVAVDREPRALAFGRLNAALNGVASKIEWRRGDLYGPLAPGERFDLVLANPPFVPSPHGPATGLAFRDAGPAGEDVLARLIAGLPGRLAREGTAAIVSVFADGDEEPWRAKLERWLPRGSDLGALLLRFGVETPAEYALAQSRRPFDDGFEARRARHERWLDAMRRAKVRRLAGGVLALRPRAGPTPPWFKAIDAGWPARGAQPEALERAWRACDAAHAVVFADEMLDKPARTPADLVLTDELERDGEGTAPKPRRHRARAASALGVEVGITPELRMLLSECDGKRTLRDVVAELAKAQRTSAAELGERLFPDLFELAERGLLLL